MDHPDPPQTSRGADALEIAQRTRRAAAAAVEPDDLIRVIAGAIPAGVFIAQHGRVCYANELGAQMLGRRPQDLVGAPFEPIVHPADQAMIADRVAAEAAGDHAPQRFEVRVVSRDGSTRWLDVSTVEIEYGGSPARLAAVLDISDRRQSEETLRETRERLELAIIGAELGVWDWNVATHEVVYSDRWASMLGYHAADLDHSYEAWERLVHPEDKDRVLRLLHQHLEGRTRYYEVEHRLRCVDGSWKWVLACGRVMLRDEQGRPLRMSGTHMDISDRKRAEELTRAHQERVAHVARVITVGELASGLAHELAQPLSAILYYARSCSARLGDGAWSGPQVLEALDKIAHQAERAGEVVRRTKAFVRERQPLSEPADLNAVIRESVALAEPVAQEHQVRFTLRLADPTPAIKLDRIQIQQVLLNLLRNAAESMTATASERRVVEVESHAAGDAWVRVRVRDHGPGVDPAILNRALDAFVSTKPGGTGLGLAISRSIIEAHGGKLELQRAPGGGAIASFTLPTGAEADHASA